MTLHCDDVTPHLEALISGLLPDDRAAALREHLAECDRCAEAHAALLPFGPDDGALARMQAALAAAERTPALPRPLQHSGLLAASLAAALLACVFLAHDVPSGIPAGAGSTPSGTTLTDSIRLDPRGGPAILGGEAR